MARRCMRRKSSCQQAKRSSADQSFHISVLVELRDIANDYFKGNTIKNINARCQDLVLVPC
jgi:hypothetical protein